MSGWVTFWTAVGALGTVGAIFVGCQPSVAPTYTPAPAPAPAPVEEVSRADGAVEDTDIGTLRFDTYVYDDTCNCNEVRSIPEGAKIRLICAASGARMSQGGRSSSIWYQVQGGYVPDVAVSTSSRFDPDTC